MSPRRRDEETPGARAERERLERRRETDKLINRLRKTQRREGRARQHQLEERRSRPEEQRNYENWIQSYGTKRQRRRLEERRSVGDATPESETRAWEQGPGSGGQWVGRPDPPSRSDRHRAQQRRWLDDQQRQEPADGRMLGGGAEGLIGERAGGPGPTGRGRGGAGGRRPENGGVIGGQLELGPSEPPPDDDGGDDGPGGGIWRKQF